MLPRCLLLLPPRPQRISLERGFAMSVRLLLLSYVVVAAESLAASDATAASLLEGEAAEDVAVVDDLDEYLGG